eukprot:2462432-Pleurochrysis_carterae.AAC.1
MRIQHESSLACDATAKCCQSCPRLNKGADAAGTSQRGLQMSWGRICIARACQDIGGLGAHMK